MEHALALCHGQRLGSGAFAHAHAPLPPPGFPQRGGCGVLWREKRLSSAAPKGPSLYALTSSSKLFVPKSLLLARKEPS
eukprot:5373577-Pyramimonas_sp.AAC.1